MKNDNHIQYMLDRFMAGTSTLEEEARLGEYFRRHEVKPEWQVYKEMFAYFDAGMNDGKMPYRHVKAGHRGSKIAWTLLAAAAAVAALLIIRTNVRLNDDDAHFDDHTASVSKNNAAQLKTAEWQGGTLKTNSDAVASAPTISENRHARPVRHASVAREEVAVLSKADSLQADSVMREAAEDMMLNYKVLLASQLQQRRALRTIDENIINAHLEALTTSLELSTEADEMKQHGDGMTVSPRIMKSAPQASSNVRRTIFMGFQ